MVHSTIAEHWLHQQRLDRISSILPDGCRDIIVKHQPGERPECFLSPLAVRASEQRTPVGTSFVGFRLRAGVGLDLNLLEQVLQAEGDVKRQMEAIEHCTWLDESIEEALNCFAQLEASALQVARELGVSERTLQRHLKQHTGKPPNFWRQLSRVRRAARSLSSQSELAEHAMSHGFADQPHMNREFKRWFSVSPVGFLAREDLIEQMHATAFA